MGRDLSRRPVARRRALAIEVLEDRSTPAALAPLEGLTAQYYDNADLTALKHDRTDAFVNFSWPDAPAPGVAPASFSVRWTGLVTAEATATYTFFTQTEADEKVRLWVNGSKLIDTWASPTAAERSGTVALTAGRRYDLKMEYAESTGTASVALRWSRPGLAKQVVPAARLTPALFPRYTPAFAADAAFLNVTNFTDRTGGSRAFDASGRSLRNGAVVGPDATANIQAAMDKAATQNLNGVQRFQTVYFPNGTYKVSDELEFTKNVVLQPGEGYDNHAVRLQLVGESRDGVTIRLADSAPGYQSAPKSVFVFLRDGSFSNIAFRNSVRNLTVDVGRGNTGAIGIDWHNNNGGVIENVAVVSSDGGDADAIGDGYAAVRIGPEGNPGLGMLTHFRAVGFSYGLSVEGNEHVTFLVEDSEVVSQAVAGVRNQEKGLQIRNLRSTQTRTDTVVPAVLNESPQGQVVVLDSTFAGAGVGGQAVNVARGWVYARNVDAPGYANAVNNRGTPVAGTAVTEYVNSPTVTTGNGGPTGSLNLPVPRTPRFGWEPESDWVRATAFTSAGIQAAIDAANAAGKSTVFLPAGRYTINETVVLGGGVRRLFGSWSFFGHSATFRDSGQPVFRVETPTHDGATIIEGIDGHKSNNGFNFTWVRNNSDKPVALKDLGLGTPRLGVYRNGGTGDVFIENVASDAPDTESANPAYVFRNQRAYLRLFNHEYMPLTGQSGDARHVINDGGQLWWLSGKLGETYGPYFETRNGGRSELLGIVINALSAGSYAPNPFPDAPAILNDNSDVSFVGVERTAAGNTEGPHPDNYIREIRGTSAHNVKHSALPQRDLYPGTDAVVVPLYRGQAFPPPLHHYRFDGNGDDAVDAPRHATLVGSPVFSASVPGDLPPWRSTRSLQLNGVSQYARLADAAAGSFADLTVSMWVKPNSTAGIQVLYKEGGSNNGITLRLNNGSLEAAIRKGGATTQKTTTAALTGTAWRHVAMTYDGGTLRLFVDGVPAGAGVVAAYGDVGYFEVISLGAREGGDAFGANGTGGYFGGLIDDVRIYGLSLHPKRVEILAGGPAPAGAARPAGTSLMTAGNSHTRAPSLSGPLGFGLAMEDALDSPGHAWKHLRMFRAGALKSASTSMRRL